MLFPLPVPETTPRNYNGDLHYMTLKENLTMPFTDTFQPSKIARKAATTTTATTSTVDVSSIGVGRGRGRGRNRGRGEGRVIAGRAVPPLIYDPVKFTI